MNKEFRIIAVRRLEVDRANLLMNDYCSGLPSPLAFLGLAAAMAPKLGAERWDIKVLPILHSVTISHGRTKPEMEPKGSKFGPIETGEDMTGHVIVSILLAVPQHCDPDLVHSIISTCRVAGGFPRPIEPNQVIDIDPDGSGFRKVARGYALVPTDRAERLVISTGDSDSLTAVAKVLYPNDRQLGFGWPVPVAVGHRLLEDPATTPPRSGTRSPTIPHVFSEPVLGIAELISVRNSRLTRLNRSQFKQLFWGWSTTDNWVLGHSAYNPNNPTPIETYHPSAPESLQS